MPNEDEDIKKLLEALRSSQIQKIRINLGEQQKNVLQNLEENDEIDEAKKLQKRIQNAHKAADSFIERCHIIFKQLYEKYKQGE